MKLSLKYGTFSCSLPLIITYLAVLSLLISLGCWQLNRAAEKRLLIAQQEQQAHSLIHLTADIADDAAALRYKMATLRGYYDTRQQFLIDNQILQGQAGYFVLTPFVLEGGKKAVLVNRGWIKANPNRKILPDVRLNAANRADVKAVKEWVITGRINQFPSVGLKLAGADIPSDTHPAVVQIVNPAVLAKKLAYPLFSFQIELDVNMAEGYTRQWQITTLMPPQQHFGYALQWFGLALTLTVLFFWYSFTRTKTSLKAKPLK